VIHSPLFFFQAEDGIRDFHVTGVQTCALPISVTNELGEKMKNIPGVSDFSLVNGFSIISGAGSNYGISFIKLDNWADRKDESKRSEERRVGKECIARR